MAAEPSAGRARWFAGSVRVRTTVGAVVVVAIALTVGGIVLVASMRRTLTDEIRASAELRAEDLASALAAGTAPAALSLDAGDDVLIQVLDAGGRVLAASAAVAGNPAVASIPAGESRIVPDVTITDFDEDEPEQEAEDFVVAARLATSSRGELTVLAGRSLDVVDSSTDTLRRLLLAGGPFLLGAMAVGAWALVGRALAPVDAMRRTVDDITASALDRRVAEPAADDEVAHLARTLNAMLDRLQRSRDRQHRFVADASHELRSPVAAIRQVAELALAHPDRTSVPALADDVVDESRRLARLIDDLLVIARADEETLATHRHEVDVDDLALAEAERLRATLTRDVRIDTAGVSAGRVLGDRRLLERVVRNLGENAARHAATTVALSVTTAAGMVTIAVDDDGSGIPDAERERIFERFVRLDEARDRDRGGTGLGLAIVAEIVAAHDGTVRATTSPLGGARIEIRLPAA